MTPEHQKILDDSRKDIFEFQKYLNDFVLNATKEFDLARLDFIRNVSTLLVGILGIIYLYQADLYADFLFISLIISVFLFLFTISLSRELPEDRLKEFDQLRQQYILSSTEDMEKIIESDEKSDISIWFNHAAQKSKSLENNDSAVKHEFALELCTFFLYTAIGFLIAAFVGHDDSYSSLYINLTTSIGIVMGAGFLSFTNWASCIMKQINTLLNFTKKV